MRKITEITIEEVVELLKYIDSYDKKRNYKLQILPIGNSVEIKNIEKWVRVSRDINTRECLCGSDCNAPYDVVADKIIMNLRDNKTVIHFVDGGGISDKTLKLMREYLTEKDFDLKTKKQ
jgi:hypothetical protein